MAPLPPPPPAPPPPPPGLGPPSASSLPKVGKSQTADRNALLSQIRSGAKLKRTTQVNDRSSPIVDGARKGSGNNSSQNSNTSNSVSSVQMQLEGIFSGGMPRLKPTVNKTTMNEDRRINDRSVRPVSGTKEIPKQPMNQYRSDNQQSVVATSSIKASLEQQFNQQQRQQLSSRTDSGLNSNKKFNTVHSNKVRRSNTSFPSDVNIGSGKGPAPSVPSINKSGPPLPSKPPTVQRSNSQSVNKTKHSVRTGPPNVKPPPPPKAKEQCFPNSQLKPAVNVNRRQSFGGSDSHTLNFTEMSQPPLPLAPPPPMNSLKPAPPPRNNSIPNGLSNHNTSQSGVNSRTPVAAVSPMPQTPKMNHSSPRPALGPPPPPPPHRTGSTRNVNSSNSGLTSYPPPPPPSSLPTKSNSVQPFQAPPPPVRHTSISKTDLESRFCSSFKVIQLLPAPDKFIGANKLYPSSALAQQQKRRIPPPPPPPPSLSGLPHAISPQLNAHHNSNSNKSNNCSQQPTLFVHLEPRLYPPGVGPGVAQC